MTDNYNCFYIFRFFKYKEKKSKFINLDLCLLPKLFYFLQTEVDFVYQNNFTIFK